MATIALDRRARLPEVGSFTALAAAALLGTIALASGRANVADAVANFPWVIVAMYVALELFAGLLTATGATDLLAVWLARRSRAARSGVLITFSLLLFIIGAFVNNLTDMIMILPIAMVMLRAIGLQKRFAVSFFALLLAISNVSGAATPIGDFPALLILGSGLTSFASYLTGAFPLFAVTGVALVAVYCLLNRGGRGAADPVTERLAISVLDTQYRYRTVNRPALVRLGVVFALMFVAWVALPSDTVPPEVIAWAGVAAAALLVRPLVDRSKVQTFDLRPVMTIAAFLFIAGLLASTGFTTWLAGNLQHWIKDPRLLVLALMISTSLMCAVISAGPAAAAMLPVLQALAGPTGVLHDQADLLAVAFAASICAGSSLFLFSATAGLMLGSKVDDAGLMNDDGEPIRITIRSYMPYGAVNYVVQMTIAIAWVMVAL